MSTNDRRWTPVALPDVPPPAGAYSPGVRAGNLYFVSGQTPRDPATGAIMGDTIEAQTRATLANVQGVLRAGGLAMHDVVSVTIYLTDEDNWGTVNKIYQEFFTAPFPTRAVVGASLRGILVEVSAIAYAP